MKLTILILDDLPIELAAYVESKDCKVFQLTEYSKEDILDVIEQVDAIIYRLFTTEIDSEIISKAVNLKCIVRTGGGAGRIDFEAAKDQNIIIMHTRGCNSFTAAEYIFGSFLMMSRRMIEGDKTFREKRIDRSLLWGTQLAGKTAGIVGFGRMGKALSKMAKNFGMIVISHSPHITEEEEQEYGITSVVLEDLYRQSDFIALTFPPSAEDRGMINKFAFEKMKKGVKIVNAAWMGIFDFQDLKDALDNKKLGGIVIDRPEFEMEKLFELLRDYPNVVLSPNLGSHTMEGQLNCGRQALDQIRDYVEKGQITNQIIR